MTRNNQIFEELMDRYGFTLPLPEEVRKETLHRKKRLYKKLMKRAGAYGIFTAVVSYVFFALRKTGIAVSFTKSAIIAAAAAGIVTVSAAGGIYQVIKTIEHKKIETSIEIPLKEKQTKPGTAIETSTDKDTAKTRRKTGIKQKSQTGEKYLLPYRVFSGDSSLSDEAKRITKGITGRIRSLQRNIIPVVSGSGQTGNTGVLLIGSVESDGDRFSVTTRLVDVKTSKILYMNTGTIPIEGSREKSYEKIARSISAALPGILKK